MIMIQIMLYISIYHGKVLYFIKVCLILETPDLLLPV